MMHIGLRCCTVPSYLPPPYFGPRLGHLNVKIMDLQFTCLNFMTNSLMVFYTHLSLIPFILFDLINTNIKISYYLTIDGYESCRRCETVGPIFRCAILSGDGSY